MDDHRSTLQIIIVDAATASLHDAPCMGRAKSIRSRPQRVAVPRADPSEMRRDPKNPSKLWQWRLECLGHSLLAWLVGSLPAAWAFRVGGVIGGMAWHIMPLRRKIVLRNLRIAYAGDKSLAELRAMAKETFVRNGGNLISAARTARVDPSRLSEVFQIENLGLLRDAMAAGRGVVLLLSHMGNWELLSRIVHLFPAGAQAGAFYRPLNNPLLDARVLRQRQADGTRMFSKRDSMLQVAGFLREGGIVGVLADQRVGRQGELLEFFGRLTRASPLPSLLARRAKSVVLALGVTTVAPGKWRGVFMPVEHPATTAHCMKALEQAMAASPSDVFWFQERWKVFIRKRQTIRDWLGEAAERRTAKPLRALLWLERAAHDWRMPDAWVHPEVIYEAVLAVGQAVPEGLAAGIRIHRIEPQLAGKALQRMVARLDEAGALPLDFILAVGMPSGLPAAAKREMVPVISLP